MHPHPNDQNHCKQALYERIREHCFFKIKPKNFTLWIHLETPPIRFILHPSSLGSAPNIDRTKAWGLSLLTAPDKELPMISRREFLASASKIGFWAGCPSVCATAVSAACAFSGTGAAAQDLDSELIRTAHKARYWTSTAQQDIDCSLCHKPEDNLNRQWHNGKTAIVKCLLCARRCVISPGERGMCRDRININGELRSLVYGRPVALHIDPIEKKPFYHFLPGSNAFSLATSGCPCAVASARTGQFHSPRLRISTLPSSPRRRSSNPRLKGKHR